MAVTNVEKKNLILNQWSEFDFTAPTSTTDGVAVDLTGKSARTVILLKNEGSGNATATIKAGNGLQGVQDLAAFTVAANKFAAIQVDSGAFKNVSGAEKGKAKVVCSATTLKVAVVELP